MIQVLLSCICIWKTVLITLVGNSTNFNFEKYLSLGNRRNGWMGFLYWDNFIERYPRTDCHRSLRSCNDIREHNGSDPRSSSREFFFLLFLFFTLFLHFFPYYFFSFCSRSFMLVSCYQTQTHTVRDDPVHWKNIKPRFWPDPRDRDLYAHAHAERWHPTVVDR